jgi:hypothetical protein
MSSSTTKDVLCAEGVLDARERFTAELGAR